MHTSLFTSGWSVMHTTLFNIYFLTVKCEGKKDGNKLEKLKRKTFGEVDSTG